MNHEHTLGTVGVIGALALLLLAITLQGQAQAQEALQRAADNTGSCDPKVEGLCYHLFDSTESAATSADSLVYEVKGCKAMTYKLDGDGTAALFVKECSTLSSGACASATESVFTTDMDGDGLITATDEDTTINGAVGRRGYKEVVPGSRWHYIDVQTVPASGTAYVSIQCHR